MRADCTAPRLGRCQDLAPCDDVCGVYDDALPDLTPSLGALYTPPENNHERRRRRAPRAGRPGGAVQGFIHGQQDALFPSGVERR